MSGFDFVGNVVLEKSFAFAVEVVAVCEELTSAKRYVLSNQLIRSGTSVGANISESEYAQSREDFISKLSVALKEAAESRYWLKLLEAPGRFTPGKDPVPIV